MLLVIYNNHHKWVEHCTTNQPKMRNNFITISSATKNKVKVTQTKSPAIKLGIGYGQNCQLTSNMELVFYSEKETVCTILALKEKLVFVQYALFSRIFLDGLLDTKQHSRDLIRQLPCIYICSKKWPTIFSFLTTTLISHTHFSKQIDPSSSQLAFQCCSIETSEIGTWRD